MTNSARRVWRASGTTRAAVITFAIVAAVSIPALALLLYRRQGEPWLVAALIALTVASLGYAYGFGLRPRLEASLRGVTVVNPLRRTVIEWEDLTVIAPGENGLVIASPHQVVEAWCIQKSVRATRRRTVTRADRISAELHQLWERYAPLPADTASGLRLRRARHDEADRLMRMERSASSAALGHIFPPHRYPYPAAEVTARWRALLRDPTVRVEILELFDVPIGYLGFDAEAVRHLGVVPQHAGAGHGSALLQYAEMEIFAGGAAEAELWVLSGNASAREFYRRHGWQDTDDARTSSWPPHPQEQRMILPNPAAARRSRR